ncbi:hypothetical protein HMI55_003726 [Coelomomyces lativittatus]|nr:hypothetical protein HMI55_003726 [Coelomomyces lativittatus]
MVLSALFILDIKGKALIARNFRGDIPMSTIEKFMPLLTEQEEEGNEQPPILVDEAGINYLFLKYNNLYFVALTRKNSNAASIFLFLQFMYLNLNGHRAT